MKNTAVKLNKFENSIFGKISALSKENSAINLGQGFPNFDGPDWIKKIVKNEIDKGNNQYSTFQGSNELRTSVARVYQEKYNLSFEPDKEITITNGATEAIFCTINALIDPGDEVIVFEPFYDGFVSCTKICGGIPVPVTLNSPDFTFDESELKKAFSDKTKLIIVNSPHNPTGKVFTKEELLIIGKYAKEYDAFIMSDEVYEHLIFDDNKHTPTATINDLKERTITISSAGKTFGFTGWKVGWVCANEKVTKAIRLVHQFTVFSVSTPMQFAYAKALDKIDQYLPSFQKDYSEKRDILYNGLSKIGFKCYKPKGTYFIIADISELTKKNDFDYCMELISEKKVATIPPSAFYLKSNEGKKYLRFCFAKKNETLIDALKNLS